MISQAYQQFHDRLVPLLSDVSDDTQGFVRAELALFRAEVAHSIAAVKRLAITAGVALIFLIGIYVSALSLVAVLLLSIFQAASALEIWGILLVIHVAAAVTLLYFCKKQLYNLQLLPKITLHSLEDFFRLFSGRYH